MTAGIATTDNAPGQESPAGTRNQLQPSRTEDSSRLNLPSPRSNASSHLIQEPPKSHRAVGEELDYYRNFLDDLVTVMRDGNQAAVAHLVDLIRSGVSKVQIHHAIQQLKSDGYNAPAPRT
ncbi:hypothetical protein PENARI_c028G02194 [Penicillium arizonense]|uniref:Uncharacterized protein n=1 Tax=Penicillium arizonense TaxID=1835702 RepID=A0A1F5L5Y4_PENAI|nr:hypothetical protein PENARI_c028G02194 [Penicillium arizonense]OGE48456.1 hypothetical protein PENARI_c028G02194 [Penicillium arizonense]